MASRSRRRATTPSRAAIAVIAAVAGGLAPVALAAAKAPTPSVPSCHQSTTKMATKLRLKQLEFRDLTPHSNLCTFKGLVSATHYHQLVQVNITPGSKSIYEQARAAGEHKAVDHHDKFTDLRPYKGDTYTAAFSV